MRILDRYTVKQLLPVWVWCLTIFVFLSGLVDLFEHLDEILRFHVPAAVVARYYANFLPLVSVRAAPLALLLAAAFVASRLTRHQEFLAMQASGVSPLRAWMPFAFVGWLASLCIFAVNDRIVPASAAVYEQLKRETFKEHAPEEIIENVATLDAFNRLYHARSLNPATNMLEHLTILEHNLNNQPTKSLYAKQALWTPHGWLLLRGTVYRVGPDGRLRGEPEHFTERLVTLPVTPDSFRHPEARPDTMSFGQLRLLIARLHNLGLTNMRRYDVDLLSKLTFPLMAVVVCLIAFTGSSHLNLRGHLRGLGVSLAWGVTYYLAVGLGEGIGRKGLLWMPLWIPVFAPHVIAVWACLHALRRRS